MKDEALKILMETGERLPQLAEIGEILLAIDDWAHPAEVWEILRQLEAGAPNLGDAVMIARQMEEMCAEKSPQAIPASVKVG